MIDEKAFQAFMLAMHKYGPTGLGYRKCLAEYESAKSPADSVIDNYALARGCEAGKNLFMESNENRLGAALRTAIKIYLQCAPRQELEIERDIFREGFRKADEVCNDYAVHVHIRGGSLQPIPECVKAYELLKKHDAALQDKAATEDEE